MNVTGQQVETVLLDRIQVGRQFAGGGEGIVYEVAGHNEYLIKVYYPDESPDKLDQLYAYKRQAYQSFAAIKLSKTKELRCLPLEYVVVNGGTPAYLMRRAQGILLTDLFPQIRGMVLEEREALGRALGHAIAQLHSSQIVQADLKLSNYIAEWLGNGWIVYVLDIDGGGYFGPQAAHFAPSTVPAPLYMSPELAQLNWVKLWAKPHLRKQPDLWALAVLLYQIIVDDDGPFSARPTKTHIVGYTPYHRAAIIDPQVEWPQPWQMRQLEQLGLDAMLVDRFSYVFGKRRFEIERYPRPEAQDWRFYLDHVLQHGGQNPYKANLASSGNGGRPGGNNNGGSSANGGSAGGSKSSGSFFNRLRQQIWNWKQRLVGRFSG